MSAACFLAGALALGHALQINNGFYNRFAILWMTLALGCTGAGVICMRWRPGVSSRASAACRGLVAAGLVWQLWTLLTSEPGLSIAPGTSFLPFQIGVLFQGIAIATGLGGLAAVRRIWFPALLGLTLALGIWMVHATPAPRIDVVVVHREAIDALADGRNPYAITFADIYGGSESGFYGASKVVDGRVTFGFPYPPLSLLLAALGQWIAGDYRYAEVLAFVLGAALIGTVASGWLAKGAAAVLVTTPRLYFVFDQGWSEPVAVLMLGFAVWTMARWPRLAALASALLLATKQYLALGVIAMVRTLSTLGELGRRPVLVATIVAAATIVPFFVWSPGAMVDALVLLQLREPFRPDSMSYLSLANRLGLGDWSRVWSVVAAAGAVTLATACTPRTAAGVAASLALACFAMFAFGSKAFCNYYFFVVAALTAAVAAISSHEAAHS